MFSHLSYILSISHPLSDTTFQDHLPGPPSRSGVSSFFIFIFYSFLRNIENLTLCSRIYHIYFIFDIHYVRPPSRTTSRVRLQKATSNYHINIYLTSIMSDHLSGPPPGSAFQIRCFIFFLFFYFTLF